MALQRLRNDPEAGWELRKRTPLWSPDFLMVSQGCMREYFIVDSAEEAGKAPPASHGWLRVGHD